MEAVPAVVTLVKLTGGAVFGERALQTQEARAGTARVTEFTELLTLDAKGYLQCTLLAGQPKDAVRVASLFSKPPAERSEADIAEVAGLVGAEAWVQAAEGSLLGEMAEDTPGSRAP